jgi:hypothetical protein
MRSLASLVVTSFAAFFVASTMVACSSDDAPESTAADANDADVKGASACTGTFRFLQKDAYKSTAGRSSPLWPPHTTTELDIACGQPAAVVATSFQANYGTEPGEKDANGDIILVETKTLEAKAKRVELDALAKAFAACTCEGGTKFLSLTDVQDEAVQKVVAELTTYAGQHLVCTGDKTTAQVVGLLENGDLNGFLGALSACSFEPGQDFEKGFNEALGKLLEASSTTLSGYHVCNNNAALQEQLFATFRDTGKVVACSNTSDLCKGPRWFYTPLAAMPFT